MRGFPGPIELLKLAIAVISDAKYAKCFLQNVEVSCLCNLCRVARYGGAQALHEHCKEPCS